jgi:hypothetical protein
MFFRTSSGALGLTNLRWNGVAISVGTAALAALTLPSFVVNKISSVLGAQGVAASQFTLTIAAGVVPSWAQPGAGVAVNVTIGGIPILLGGVIKDITSTTIVISPAGTDGRSITTAWTNQSLDAVAGSVVNTVTLNMICQRAFFYLPSTATQNVNLAAVADSNGANPGFQYAITPGDAPFELEAPVGAKFDLSDLFFQAVTSSQTLQILFM